MKKLNTRDDDTPVLEGAWGDIDLGTQMYTKAGVENRLGDISTTVSQYIAEKISVAYKAGGSKAAANFTSALLVAANEGMVYNLTDTLTIDAQKASLFIDAAEGKAFAPGTNIVVVNTAASGETAAYKFDVLAPTDATLVKSVNGQTPNASGEVTIPNAVATGQTGATNGLMTAADKAKLDDHLADNDIHVTTSDKTSWNGAVSDLATHTANTTVHITADERAAWNAKYDKPSTGIPSTDMTAEVQASLGKANTALQEHQDISGKVDKEPGKGLSTNDYTDDEKTKLAGVAAGAEVNQNAFSNVKIGATTIAASSKTDTVTLVGGTNITLTPDATNKTITIAGPATIDISGKADKVANATSGNFAGLDSTGNLTDSGSKAADFATADQGALADTAVQDVKVQIGTGTAATIVSNKTATLTVAEGTTNGTIAVAGTDVAVHGLGSAAYTESTAYATSAQGAKADTAVQGVKLAGAENALALDANKVATIPNAVGTGDGATNGLMTAADKAKLDGFDDASNYKTKQDPITDSGTGYVSAVIQNADGVISVTKTALPSQTTYTLGGSGTTVTLTPSSGSATNYTIPDVVASTSGSGGSAGVMTAAQAEKLAGIAAGAQVNVLEGVQVNGTDLTITDKAVDLTLSDAVNSDSSTQFASSKAVKTANDTATTANTKVSAVNNAAASLLTALNDTATVSKTMNTANDIKAVVEALITALKTFAGAANNV